MKSDKNIREGYKRTAVGVIPKEWEVKKMKDLEVLVKSGNNKFKSDEGAFKVYGSTGIIGYADYFQYDENLILCARVGANAGYIYSIDEKCDVSDNTLIISNFINVNSKFYEESLKQYNLNRLIFGSGQPLITGTILKNIQLPIPPLPEQQAIANCLTTWDSGIEKLTQLIAAKREQKKGLMQQLLTGKKRLDGFVGEWKEVKLEDLSFRKTSSLKSSDLIENSGKYGVYGATGFITKVDFYDEKEPYIAIVKDGSGVGNMYLLEGESSVIGTMDKIFPKDSNLIFLYNRMKGFNFGKYKVGGAIPHIYYKDYSKEIISIPSLDEQKAIANVLFTADQEISLLEAKLAAMKEEKKGLMQVLLTGEKRLIDS